MTDLIDSLLEFARTRESLSPAYGNVVGNHPALRSRGSPASPASQPLHRRALRRQVSGWFDQRKLERALYNLLLNACEAAPAVGGQVEVTAAEVAGSITISVADNGPGIAESIRERLFHPFVSYGKENGTGLGLAVVQKIVQDHGGEIAVERTAQGRTVFRIVLPGRVQDASRAGEPSWTRLRWCPRSAMTPTEFDFASGPVGTFPLFAKCLTWILTLIWSRRTV